MKNREPDKIDENGAKLWHNDKGELHNDFGYPAVINQYGSKAWYQNGICHNSFGPAVVFRTGEEYWYIDGKEFTEHQFKQHKIKQFING